APAPAPAKAIDAQDLRRGIEAGELEVRYQPQITLADGKWVGVEALVTWQHPQHGRLLPQSFIALAESSGLAMLLTRTVLEKTISDFSSSPLNTEFSGTVSVNLPPVALNDKNFPQDVKLVCQQHGFSESRLIFELTETSVAADPIQAAEVLTRLRLSGFGLAIDDFGTGHSSMLQLKLLPFTELKIDMSFIRSLLTDSVSQSIVTSAIDLGQQLGLTVLAEGVENQAIYDWLKAATCDRAQGWHMAKSLPASELLAWSQHWLKSQA
ncbi:MAG: EAL domain-containing protein, partial [Burkholderiaceae bacterium]